MASVADKASRTGKKGMELTAKAWAQTASGSKAVANEIAKGAKDLSEKAKVDSYNKRMKKYNPLFPEEYNSVDFHVPNIICIVDDAVRRDSGGGGDHFLGGDVELVDGYGVAGIDQEGSFPVGEGNASDRQIIPDTVGIYVGFCIVAGDVDDGIIG